MEHVYLRCFRSSYFGGNQICRQFEKQRLDNKVTDQARKENNTMKKGFTLLLTLAMLLSLTACGSTAEMEIYAPKTQARFNKLLQEWLPDNDFVLGSSEKVMEDVVCEEIDTIYKQESRYRITSLSALEHWGIVDVELMFSDKTGLFGFWIEKKGDCVAETEEAFGAPMAEGATGGYTWLIDGPMIWAQDYEDDSCFFLVCTDKEAQEKYDTNMELLLDNGASIELSNVDDGNIAVHNEDMISLDEPQPDESFVSDWTEGNENIYGYGTVYNGTVDQISTDDDYHFVVQDGWVYYFWVENGIYKMPVEAADGGQVFKLASLNGWVYDLSVMKDWLYYYENDQLVRLRTDGMVQEVLPLRSEEIRDTDGYYLAYDQLYYVSKTRRSASEFNYEMRKLDLNTMEDTAIVSGVRRIEQGYKDSIFIYTADKTYSRIDLEGNLLTEYSYKLPTYLWDEGQELFIGTIGENTYAGDNLGYIWLNGETQRNEDISNIGFNSGDYYVCTELGKVFHSKNESVRGIYCTDMDNFDTVQLNLDRTEVFYSWGDGYIYYPTSIDKDGRGVRIFCRIQPDGTGWEDVSWMFY